MAPEARGGVLEEWGGRMVGRADGSRALKRVFRHPVDVFPTAIIFGLFAAQLAIFFGVESLAWSALWVVLLFPVQVNFAGMCHNHHHAHTFRRAVPNRIFEVVMFLQLGMLPFGYTLHHNIGHHTRYMDQSRDPNRWKRADGSPMNSWEFAWLLFVHMYPNVFRLGREHPAVFRKFLRMSAVCAGVLAALLILDPAKALLVFLLPMPAALLLQCQATYYQHVGLESDDPLLASRSALGRFYNLRTGNLGYHTAHHLKPGLHWSKLPEMHARLSDRIPSELVL